MVSETNAKPPLDFSNKGLAVRLGRLFFQSRNFISAPLFVFMLFFFRWEYENDAVLWPTGIALVCLGETLRLWAMRHIGRSARTRRDKARRLVNTGPYAYTRNPLYIGNHLILTGFCVLSELLWFIPAALGLCFVFYNCIVLYEEELLRQRFGEEYLSYMRQTARWIPLPFSALTPDSPWLEAFRRERSTLYGLVAGIAVFALEEFILHLIH
ncbi:MAG: isoprenylcysteine carboxylmethyltransferase family protein [Candidatus Abyssobacteria bacterium SURF_17]|uniref:Isoprenylcysteine carboxylmethyltransferase family protein n=1 Tax=Candidatus Abyssobacteria bacterium SURF_17 TaxID=2093361 RepID=A0A419EZG6_9BACT|nr:MAG: isoprenylcysteine carboxylmethyltransferase family protein [Candidatus Abyssubacteria bacterium SURF_17]